MLKNKQAAIVFIFITVLVDIIGLGIIIPVIPQLIQKLTNNPSLSNAAKYGGKLMLVYAVLQFLFSPLLGALSDKYGRRPVLLLSLVGFGADYLLSAFAPSIFWLFVARSIAGITGGSITTASAYIADVSTPDKKAQNFGMIGLAFGLGFIIGPALGGVLGKISLQLPFFVAAGLALLNALYGYFVLPESLPVEQRRNFDIKRANPLTSIIKLGHHKVVLGLVFSLFFLYIGGYAVQGTWTYYTMYKFGWNQSQIGWSLAYVGVMVAIVQGVVIRKVVPKMGNKKAVYVGFFFYTLGLFLFSMAHNGQIIFLYITLYSLGGLAGPAIQGIISNKIPANEQGELQGGLTSVMSLAAICGPPIMTQVFSYFIQPNTPFHFAGAAMLLGCLMACIGFVVAYNTLSKED